MDKTIEQYNPNLILMIQRLCREDVDGALTAEDDMLAALAAFDSYRDRIERRMLSILSEDEQAPTKPYFAILRKRWQSLNRLSEITKQTISQVSISENKGKPLNGSLRTSLKY